MPAPELILASTSTSRKALLERLRMPFRVVAPEVVEATVDGEPPGRMAARLAQAKAAAVSPGHPDVQTKDFIVIGSDQVLEANGQKLGKPGSHDRAVEQLGAVSGRWVRFHTALTVTHPAAGYSRTVVETYDLRFRSLSRSLIDRYLHAERPYDCAGSLKVESLGIILLSAERGTDQTTVLGLPLMALIRLLREAGLDPDFEFQSE